MLFCSLCTSLIVTLSGRRRCVYTAGLVSPLVSCAPFPSLLKIRFLSSALISWSLTDGLGLKCSCCFSNAKTRPSIDAEACTMLVRRTVRNDLFLTQNFLGRFYSAISILYFYEIFGGD
ncbi:hypothetical protein BDQ17DRAFT_1376902 [Cyathus striatus]|nr:hypothetical protein BDQ17DRAFT_1376902 [Cyathus striatus]